jgi:hypothetical protein
MIMYAWEVLPADGGALPLWTGVCGDQGRAREAAATELIASDRAVLARVEAVRPSLHRPREYERTGREWLGTRARGGCGVRWSEQRGCR